ALPAFSEHSIELRNDEVGTLCGEAQRWLHLEHVRALGGGEHNHAELFQPLANRRSLSCCGLHRFAVAHELNAKVETFSVHGADNAVLLPQCTESIGESRTNHARVLLQLIVVHRIKHSDADSAR